MKYLQTLITWDSMEANCFFVNEIAAIKAPNGIYDMIEAFILRYAYQNKYLKLNMCVYLD